MSTVNATTYQHESGAGDNLILAADGTTTIPGGTNRPKIVGYQQGSWSGVVSGATSGVVTYSAVEFKWMRIGQLVTVWFSFRSGNKATAGAVEIQNLPYQSSAMTVNFPGFIGDRGPINYGSGFNDVYTRVGYQSDYADLMQKNADNHGEFTNASLPTNCTIRGTQAYLTDDTTWQPINGATVDP